MLAWCGWHVIKSILETFYFLAGIGIAVFAYKGLRQLEIGVEQLELTKEIAKKDALREAIKFATERCQYFADMVAPEQNRFSTAYQSTRCTFLNLGLTCTVKDGEISASRGYSSKAFEAEESRILRQAVSFLNTLEAFAIPFVARVADDSLGFQETGRAFCAMVKDVLPLVYEMGRKEHSGRYESTVKLYEHWNDMLIAEDAAINLKRAEQASKSRPKPERIEPL
jgi:hypothetical protein